MTILFFLSPFSFSLLPNYPNHLFFTTNHDDDDDEIDPADLPRH